LEGFAWLALPVDRKRLSVFGGMAHIGTIGIDGWRKTESCCAKLPQHTGEQQQEKRQDQAHPQRKIPDEL
jgi:hypothetical protein